MNSTHQIQTLLKSVESEFKELQSYIVNKVGLSEVQPFNADKWSYDSGGGGCSMILEHGNIIEKGGVNFSLIKGNELPASATLRKPELSGKPFFATGVSVVMHPDNPYIPTSHANVRFFIAETDEGITWWFGGGFDLTPYYADKQDCIDWHVVAKSVCDKYSPDYYEKYKKQCDDYFYIKHRNEHRGIGGIFFDDFKALPFEQCLSFVSDVARAYIDCYQNIIEKRKSQKFSEHQKDFQAYRRGRYVEFNLVYDRGTIFGLQSNGRTESILMSMPPLVRWDYNKQFELGTAEYELTNYYLKPKNWIAVK